MRCNRSIGLADRVFPASIFVALLALSSVARAEDPKVAYPRASQLGYAATPQNAAPSAFQYAPWSASPAAVAPAPTGPKSDSADDDKKKGEHSVGVDVGVVTEVPILAGGQITLTVPYGLMLQGEVGVLPSAYVNATDGILSSAGAYDAATSEMIRNALGDSLVVRLSGGWKPFDDHGLELLGGYTVMSLGGGVSARSSIEAATGATLPAEIPDAKIPLHSTIHAVHATLGWRWMLGEHVVLRASLGYLQAVGSSSHVDLPSSLMSNAQVASGLATANRIVDTTLNDAYTKYMKLPVMGLSLGYKF